VIIQGVEVRVEVGTGGEAVAIGVPVVVEAGAVRDGVGVSIGVTKGVTVYVGVLVEGGGVPHSSE
jgi:hypothetical protein